jgi:hypothetical protein
MKKVTYLSAKYQKTLKGPFIQSEIVEYTQADEAGIRLRALALNWTVLKIEAV